MPLTHILLALMVVTIWGVNFLFVKVGLEEISPLLLCALRFILSSIPAVFFIKLPPGSFKITAIYGLVMFALQFALVFIGMNVGMTAGMASLIMQVQVFFSMLFAAVLLGEKPGALQILGALVSFMGIGVVAFHFDANVSLLGFLCILGAAATWGVGNLITKKIKSTQFISVIVWGSFVACFPMLILALLIEGPSHIQSTYEQISLKGIGALLYIVYASTWVGYGIWNYLISKYPVGVVVPFTLLVPVVGILSSIVFLNEPFQVWKLTAGLLVVGGLCINLLNMRLFMKKVHVKD